MNARATAIPMICAVLLFAACESDTPTEPPPAGGGDPPATEPPVPVPEGTLLDGDASSSARGATAAVAPTPAEETDIGADGLLITRLDAILSPNATVGEVNAALDAAGAKIVAMMAGAPFVTLKTEPFASETEARGAAEALMATGAFSYAAPAFDRTVEPIAAPPVPRLYPEAGDDAIPHLKAMNFHSAWNAGALATANQERIPVIVPDLYVSPLPHDEIDAQDILGWGGITALPGNEVYPGNHGFAVSGIIGANFDDTPATGTSPDPNTLLDVVSLPTGGLTWFDVINLMGWYVATSGDRFVVNTSIGWNDPGFTTYSAIERISQILCWRIAAATHYHKFIHVASAGSQASDSRVNSIFTANAYFDDVRPIVDEDPSATEADRELAEVLWQDMVDNFPLATALQNNVIVVGSSDDTGALSAFSNTPYHVLARGEQVPAPCRQADPAYDGANGLCDGSIANYSGTSMAAPQIAGLAAYMMSLRPDTGLPSVRQTIIDNFDASQGTVDAFQAILDLDTSLDDAPIRQALLDVIGIPPAVGLNDRFDEYDMEEILLNLGSGDHSRYDLNGDGAASAFRNAPFDLNADGQLGTVEIGAPGSGNVIDENSVNDVQLLCYYAFSSLYRGTIDGREEQLGLLGYLFCPWVSMYGELRTNDGDSRPEQEVETHLFPQVVNVSENNERVWAEVNGKAILVKASQSTVGNDEDAASVTARFRDRFTIDAPGLTGTSGTVTVRFKLSGNFTVTAGGCENDDPDASAWWNVGYSIGTENAVYSGNKRTCDGVTGTLPPGDLTVAVDFTYGTPIPIHMDVSCAADGDPGSSTAEVSWWWQGFLDLPVDATVTSCSGLDYTTSGTVPSAP